MLHKVPWGGYAAIARPCSGRKDSVALINWLRIRLARALNMDEHPIAGSPYLSGIGNGRCAPLGGAARQQHGTFRCTFESIVDDDDERGNSAGLILSCCWLSLCWLIREFNSVETVEWLLDCEKHGRVVLVQCFHFARATSS